MIHHGNCVTIMADMPEHSVDAIVCDPPYDLTAGKNSGGGFMGKQWDATGVAFDPDTWRAALRVLKPGGHLLAFGGTRTWHRLAVAVEDAGFEIRDSIAWMSGSGFPKSLDVSKAIDRTAGRQGASTTALKEALRERFVASGMTRSAIDVACGFRASNYLTLSADGKRPDPWVNVLPSADKWSVMKRVLGCEQDIELDEFFAAAEREVVGIRAVVPGLAFTSVGPSTLPVTAPATAEAAKWQGWGTALKPSHEGIVCAVKPLVASGILDVIGSHLDRLECEWSTLAKRAGLTSTPTHPGSHAAKTGSAPARAATQHADEQEPATGTGRADASSAATGTSVSGSMVERFWNTGTSWRTCLAELYELTSMSITETTSAPTTALRILSSSISSLTATSMLPTETNQSGLTPLAQAVDNLFGAALLSWRATHSLTATEAATANTATGSFEPIVVARKPLDGTVAANVLRYGTGALNIDGCRVGYRSESDQDSARPQGQATALNGALAGKAQSCQSGMPTTDSSTTAPTTGTSATSPMGFAPNAAGSQRKAFTPNQSDLGRWPANVVLDEDQAAALDAQSGNQKDGVAVQRNGGGQAIFGGIAGGKNQAGARPDAGFGDQGGASRFFYVARKDDECNPASTAESSSSQPSELAGSAPSGAATSARLDTARLTDSPSTSATASESSTSAPSGTPVTPTTDERFSLEPQPARRTPTLDLASGAAANAPTDTTMTTTSRSRFDGFADRATSNGTRPNSEPGDLDSRFKYCAKAPKNERPVVDGVAHPTVKPLSLMRWLVRLVTPPGGTVLDPFAGSGTTIEAAILEGFTAVGIEQDAAYLPLIQERIRRSQARPDDPGEPTLFEEPA